jgi:RimJ/RimL family protein N-acetyltransferase
VLENDHIRLEPLTAGHADALEAAAADGNLGDLWYTSTPGPGEAAAYIAEALVGASDERMIPFAVVDRRRGSVVGTTRYYDIQLDVPRMAIGYTWYARSAQRTHVNSTCKRLLLAHAFDTVGCATVEFHTDFRNRQSREALERLGARQDGILRSHQLRPDGTLRDTVCFSIVAGEWPDVRRSLDLRISRLLATPTPSDRN